MDQTCVARRAEKDELLTAAVGEEAGDVEQLGLVPVAIAWLFRLVAAERERAPSATSASTSTSTSSGTGAASSGAPAGDSRYSSLDRSFATELQFSKLYSFHVLVFVQTVHLFLLIARACGSA